MLSCQHSALSTAGNVIGILTFAAGVLVGLIIRARLIASSTAELSVIIEENNSAARQLRKFLARLNELASSSASSLYRRDLEDLDNLIETALGLGREIEGRMEKLRDYGRRAAEVSLPLVPTDFLIFSHFCQLVGHFGSVFGPCLLLLGTL